MFVDNRYVEGSNWPITRRDAAGNTYQRRTLDNGDEHEVLKNFPSARELETAIADAGGVNVSVVELTHYWCAAYDVRESWLDAPRSRYHNP
jgi:demethylmenaquinone methyltransferase/2-methoxy-6-polyprenyl-1,4-benzoquinol methylase